MILSIEELRDIYNSKVALEEAESLIELAEEKELYFTKNSENTFPRVKEKRDQLQKKLLEMTPHMEETLEKITNPRAYLICCLHFRDGYSYASIGRMLQADQGVIRQSANWAIAQLQKKESEDFQK